MKTSLDIDQLSTAIAMAQGVLKNPPKLKTNPHFKSQYVDLSDGLAAVRECFSKQGLSFIQGTSVTEAGMIVLHTRIAHKSGQWIESDYPVGGLGRPQEMGSAMTYARRYALFAMVGVAGEDDDDGNAAQAAENPPAKAAKASGKQMEPGLKPDDSEKLMGVMKGVMDMVDTVDGLTAWANEHKAQIDMLLPSHRSALQEAYKARKKELTKPNA
jgi:hypothetical protein